MIKRTLSFSLDGVDASVGYFMDRFVGDTYDARRRERTVATRLLSSLTGRNVEIVHSEQGVPSIAGSPLRISISHCATSVAVVADICRPVGVDVETPRAQLERVKTRFLADEELPLFVGIDRLLLAWTAKEAVYKAALTPGLAFRHIRLSDPVCALPLKFSENTGSEALSVSRLLSTARFGDRLFTLTHLLLPDRTTFCLAIPSSDGLNAQRRNGTVTV